MRIAHVSATFPPYYGGTGNVCYHNARALAARGHEVHVFTAASHGEQDDPEGVTVRRVSPVIRVGNAAFLPQMTRLRHIEMIHLHYPFIGGAEYVLGGSVRSHIPVVLTYHNDLVAPGLRGWIFRLYDRLVTTQALARARRVCVVSLDHAQSSPLLARLLAQDPARFVDLPNGVSVETFHPGVCGDAVRARLGIPGDAFVVAFVAALDSAHYFKRLDLLLEALALQPEITTHLLVVGSGNQELHYRKIAGTLGVQSRVHFVGSVRHDRLPPYLAAADVLALGSDRVESFGLVLLEAMAVGRPVVATDIPGVRSVVRNGEDGLLVEPGSADALADALSIFTQMPIERRREMGQAGRRKVECRYSWKRIAAQLEQIYIDVAD